MAKPLTPVFQQKEMTEEPKQVRGVALVDLALVSWVDEDGQGYVQLAVVGKNNVTMLDSRTVGFGRERVHAGAARDWLRDGIFEKLGRTVPESKE